MKIAGKVVKGFAFGKKMGFPTINVEAAIPAGPAELAFGVYAARVYTTFGVFKGAFHFGPRRVLNSMKPILEVHLLDFSGDLYGQDVQIEIMRFIRDTRDFQDPELLKKQIAKDVEQVRKLNIPL